MLTKQCLLKHVCETSVNSKRFFRDNEENQNLVFKNSVCETINAKMFKSF